MAATTEKAMGGINGLLKGWTWQRMTKNEDFY